MNTNIKKLVVNSVIELTLNSTKSNKVKSSNHTISEKKKIYKILQINDLIKL